MSVAGLSEQIASRIALRGLVVTDAAVSQLAVYLAELARWNRRVNLTAIALEPAIGDAAIDKLLVEPLMATTLLGAMGRRWLDLGSGGGSPAIPLRIVWRAGSLTMVESRERKGVFLREVSRLLGLAETTAETTRFEALSLTRASDLITIRAVRIDSDLVDLLDGLLAPSGVVLAFGGAVQDHRFLQTGSVRLPDGSLLTMFGRR